MKKRMFCFAVGVKKLDDEGRIPYIHLALVQNNRS